MINKSKNTNINESLNEHIRVASFLKLILLGANIYSPAGYGCLLVI